MPDGSDDRKGGLSTPVVVALISLAGVLATALIGNWDKLFGHRDAGVAQVQQQAQPQATSTPSAVPSAPPAPDRGDAASIAGTWRDTDGYSFVVAQDGTSISYRQFYKGRANGSATGTLNGRDLRYRFKTTGDGADAGTCMATLAEDGEHISGRCTSDGGGPDWQFTITRA